MIVTLAENHWQWGVFPVPKRRYDPVPFMFPTWVSVRRVGKPKKAAAWRKEMRFCALALKALVAPGATTQLWKVVWLVAETSVEKKER
jgi:hypothetical protein